MALQLALKTELIQKFALNPWLIPFFLAFALVAQFILPLPDLLSGGGDATSIWQTIITFRNEKITSSYVLYKGFLSVYPYIWFYELSIFWGLDPFFFIKIYHSLLFSFVAAIGIPYLVSKILNIKINIYKSVIFVVVLFSLTKFTHIYSMLMVDLPSAAFFVGAMCAVYLSYGFNSIWRIVALLLSGLMVGLTLSSSGQYSLAGYLLAIYVVVSIVDSRNLFVKYGNVKIILISIEMEIL